jgi:hypothetical protein
VMFVDDPLDPTNLCSAKSTTPLQSARIQPEFCSLILPLDMGMWRFFSITGIKEKPIKTHPHDCWHR